MPPITLLEGISWGRLIDQLDNGLDFLLSQLSVILRGVLDCRLAQDGREFKTVVRDISNEGVAESLTGFKFFDSVASNLAVHIEVEVLEALVDTQVNGQTKSLTTSNPMSLFSFKGPRCPAQKK